ELGIVLLLNRGPHRTNEYSVAVGDRCDDVGGDVVLRRKDSRCLEISIVGLSPELRARPSVDELSAHANAGTSLADASFQHVTRAEFGAKGPFVSSLSLQPRGRGARDDREIPKPRNPGPNILAQTVGERLHLRVTRTLEGKHCDPRLFAAPARRWRRSLFRLLKFPRRFR